MRFHKSQLLSIVFIISLNTKGTVSKTDSLGKFAEVVKFILLLANGEVDLW